MSVGDDRGSSRNQAECSSSISFATNIWMFQPDISITCFSLIYVHTGACISDWSWPEFWAFCWWLYCWIFQHLLLARCFWMINIMNFWVLSRNMPRNSKVLSWPEFKILLAPPIGCQRFRWPASSLYRKFLLYKLVHASVLIQSWAFSCGYYSCYWFLTANLLLETVK